MPRRQMEAMPQHDPLQPGRRPPDYERAAEAWAHYKAMMKWMALVAVACALLSIVYLKQAGGPLPIQAVIAVLAGVALIILVATGLMGLVFLSNRGGHDDEANRSDWSEHDRN